MFDANNAYLFWPTCCAFALVVFILDVLSPAAPPATSEAASRHDFQYRADSEVFHDELYRFGDPPSREVVGRMFARTRSNPDDPEALFWAGRSAVLDWDPDEKADGLALIRKAADVGYVPAVTQMGVEYGLGVGVEKDQKAAIGLLRSAYEKHDARATAVLGAVIGNSDPTGNSGDEVERYLKLSWDEGYMPAATMLAQLYSSRHDVENKLLWLGRSADAGDVAAMLVLANYYGTTSPPKDHIAAVGNLVRGAMWGDPSCCLLVALDLEAGRLGMTSDPRLSACLLVRAAHGGNSAAEAELAQARIVGRKNIRVPRDVKRGVRDLSLLAANHDESGAAEYFLGECLIDGTGMEADIPRGLSLIHKAAGKGWRAAIDRWTKLSDEQKAIFAHSNGKTADAAPRAPSPTEQAAQDDDDFLDWWRWEYDTPEKSAIPRIIDRARKDMQDVHALTWASLAVLADLTHEATRDEATAWLKKAAALGDPVAMAVYGDDLVRGKDFQRDVKAGLMYVRRAVEKGEPMAYGYLGEAYVNGEPGMPVDFDRGVRLLKEGIARGTSRLSYVLFEVYDKHGDYENATGYLKEALDNGDFRAIALIPRLLQGRLTLASRKGPYQFGDDWRDTADRGVVLGDPSIMVITAIDLANHGTPNPALFRMFLRRAATKGSIEAAAVLAAAHVTGAYGVEVDPERGVAELERLVQTGEPSRTNWGRIESQWQLGRLLAEGLFIPADEERGRLLIHSAAEMNHPYATAWLAAHSASSKK